jgi:outer membrane protein assembly factor BamB
MRRILSKNPAVKTIALALLVLAGCSAAVPDKAELKPWNTHLYDAARTNTNPEGADLPPRLAWKRVLGPAGLAALYKRVEHTTPVVSGGMVYLGSVNEKFYALNRDRGWTAWLKDAGSSVESTATVADGLVCFGSSGGVLRCLDRITGAEAWRFQAKSEIISSPLVNDGRLFFYSSDDRVYALDIKSGKKIWAYTRGTFRTVALRNTGSPAFSGSKGGGRIFQLFSDGSLVCLEASTGKVLWEKKVLKKAELSGVFRKTPLVVDGSVYIIDDAGSIVAYDVKDGASVGYYTMIKARDFLFVDRTTIVMAGQDVLVAFDRSSNTTLWKRRVEPGTISGIFSSGSHIFITSNHTRALLGIEFLSRTKGYIQAVSVSDGRVVWKKLLGSTVSARASVAEGSIPLFLDTGRLVLFTSKNN